MYLYFTYFYLDFLSQHENALKQEFAVRRPELMEYINWSQLHIPRKENGITGIVKLFINLSYIKEVLYNYIEINNYVVIIRISTKEIYKISYLAYSLLAFKLFANIIKMVYIT